MEAGPKTELMLILMLLRKQLTVHEGWKSTPICVTAVIAPPVIEDGIFLSPYLANRLMNTAEIPEQEGMMVCWTACDHGDDDSNRPA